MFQAEYSSGQPLRMLVDLRASVEAALEQASGPGNAAGPQNDEPAERSASAAAAGQSASAGGATSESTKSTNLGSLSPKAVSQASDNFSVAKSDDAEFEVAAAAPEWNPDADS